MDSTLDVLPGGGETRTTLRVRRECDHCSNAAHFRSTYLLPNTRSNSESSAFGKDDCSWCSDAEEYTCKGCQREGVDGYEFCSTFPASARFAHMFLEWKSQPPAVGAARRENA